MRRAFGASLPTDEELAVSTEITEFERTLAFFDGPEIVATAGIFSYEMTVAGSAVPCGGVTRVSVLSTHRRRGLLTAMMQRQLDDMHERGEPLAALYASEAPIYGRFGYGLATYQAAVEIERSHAAFAQRVSGRGRLAMVDVPAAVGAFTRVWERVRRNQPGMLGLDARWMRNQLANPSCIGRAPARTIGCSTRPTTTHAALRFTGSSRRGTPRARTGRCASKCWSPPPPRPMRRSGATR